MKRRSFSIAIAALLQLGCTPDEDTNEDHADAEGSSGGEPGDVGESDSDSASESTGAEPDPAGAYHPPGFGEASVHAVAAKLQQEDCRTCHGTDLTGIPASGGPSCDGCHPAGWRSDCTFCHGGDQDPSGAPPRDIDGASEEGGLSFRAHTVHVLANATHGAFDCGQCHAKPTEATSPGHMFDDTPGYAEVDFAAGLSAQGEYAAGSCASLYCHGGGQISDGVAHDGMPSPGCGGCHGYDQPATWSAMSGRHTLHLSEGFSCSTCHGAIIDAAGVMLDPARHVDGLAQIEVTEGSLTYDGAGCTGLCHLQVHFSESWQ